MSQLTDVDHAVALARAALDTRYDACGLMEAGPDTRLEIARVAVYAAGPLIVRQTLRSAIEAIKAIDPGSYDNSLGGYSAHRTRTLHLLGEMLGEVKDVDPPPGSVPAGLEVSWWGEDGERLGCDGHVDLAVFEAAATEVYLTDETIFTGPAKHIWLRPLTAEYAMSQYKVTADRAADLVRSDEHWQPCEPDAEGARPFTVIDTAL